MRFTIIRDTQYRFHRPVTLGSHRLLVTPRSGNELRVLDLTIDAGPGATIAWSDDVFANWIATISFAPPATI